MSTMRDPSVRFSIELLQFHMRLPFYRDSWYRSASVIVAARWRAVIRKQAKTQGSLPCNEWGCNVAVVSGISGTVLKSLSSPKAKTRIDERWSRQGRSR